MKKRKHSRVSESAELSEADDAEIIKVNIQTKSSSLSPNPSDLDEAPPSPPPPKSVEKATPSPKKKLSSSPLKNFISQHPELEKVALDDVVSEDDDICVLEVPSTLDSDCFIGKLINFDKKTKLKISGKKYIIEPNFEDVRSINLISRGIKVVKPVANLKLREYHKNKPDDNIVNVDKCKPTLPEKIKVRHPLFGVEYKKKIELSEEVQRKLDNSIEKALQKIKKKKKKNKHVEKEDSQVKNNIKPIKQEAFTSGDDEQDGPFFEALRSHCEKKNKSKHRIKAEVDDQFYESSLDEKKKKTHQVSPEYKEEKDEKKKKRKSSFNEGSSDEKRRKHSSHTFESNNSFEEKKHGNNLVNSTVIPGLHLPLFDFDVSGIINKDSEVNNDDLEENEQSVKSKKKKKTVKVEPETDHSVSSEGTSPKKKKKKIKEEKVDEQTNSLIFDLLNKVKSEIDSPAKHKKKKKADG
nr:PREDICTED: B3 domain-containing protein Os02g0598200 [Tribolium castaneum]|eukprot:XP_015833688.1 PREDICTED: B3 domain-containing protein Os02g0598200 [Tribolium castaneum]